jgi:hypothetical protein
MMVMGATPMPAIRAISWQQVNVLADLRRVIQAGTART